MVSDHPPPKKKLKGLITNRCISKEIVRDIFLMEEKLCQTDADLALHKHMTSTRSGKL